MIHTNYLRMKFCATLICCCLAFSSVAQDYNIKDFGAKADGKTLNTKPIQAAIDRCSKTGGRVIIPAGKYLSGTLYLKSNVELHLLAGALLQASASYKDYPDNMLPDSKKTNKAFIYAQDVSHISISGKGTINGNGQSQEFQLGDDSGRGGNGGRPTLVLMKHCRNINIFHVRFESSAFWMQSYVDCENLHIKGITIYNHVNYNNDAIDIDSRNVLIEDCIIDSDDDALCLKSHETGRLCENVTIRNCVVASNCNAIKFGTASLGGFRNINISNITIRKASEDRIRHWQKNLQFIARPITVLAGIAIENVDGGVTDNITISNIFMTDVQTPVFIKLGNRSALRKSASGGPGHLRNVILSNITAESQSKITSSITGFPGYAVENVQLNNIHIRSIGTGTKADAEIVLPENEKQYPENRMFGFVSPAGGLFVRHVKGISIQNCSWVAVEKDERPVVVVDDVQDMEVSLLRSEGFNDSQGIIKKLD